MSATHPPSKEASGETLCQSRTEGNPDARDDPTGRFCYDEVLDQVHLWTLDLRCISTELETVGPLWGDLAGRLTDVARDLEELVAELRGQSRYRVVVEHGTVFAVNEEEAIEQAGRGGGPPDEVHTKVEKDPPCNPSTTRPGGREDSSRERRENESSAPNP